MCIYLWGFLLLQPHHTTELCFSSLWLWVEISGTVSMNILIEKGLLELLLYLIKNGKYGCMSGRLWNWTKQSNRLGLCHHTKGKIIIIIMLVVNMHSHKASIVDQLICIHTSSAVYWILGLWVDYYNIIIGIVYIAVWLWNWLCMNSMYSHMDLYWL